MSELIRTENLEKRYSVGDAEVIALKSCNLTLEKGEQLAIMGPVRIGKKHLAVAYRRTHDPHKRKRYRCGRVHNKYEQP